MPFVCLLSCYQTTLVVASMEHLAYTPEPQVSHVSHGSHIFHLFIQFLQFKTFFFTD